MDDREASMVFIMTKDMDSLMDWYEDEITELQKKRDRRLVEAFYPAEIQKVHEWYLEEKRKVREEFLRRYVEA